MILCFLIDFKFDANLLLFYLLGDIFHKKIFFQTHHLVPEPVPERSRGVPEPGPRPVPEHCPRAVSPSGVEGSRGRGVEGQISQPPTPKSQKSQKSQPVPYKHLSRTLNVGSVGMTKNDNK